MHKEELIKSLEGLSVTDQLKKVSDLFPGKVLFTTSLGIEDQAITHMIFSKNINIRVATLDTGRLFPQTYDVMANTIAKYNKKIEIFFPNNKDVEQMVTEKGPMSFYRSVGNRKECCKIRKIDPLNRALNNVMCWISGIRSDQSDNRGQMSYIEYEAERSIFKYYPIFSWTYDDVKAYVNENNIPYNSLHDKGFVSIGCEPCTKAIKPGESFRAGRWWWENEGAKECGLHVK
jgi:phosphoadenosine phosphosulfate reductase